MGETSPGESLVADRLWVRIRWARFRRCVVPVRLTQALRRLLRLLTHSMHEPNYRGRRYLHEVDP
jgi:hypothetical protein